MKQYKYIFIRLIFNIIFSIILLKCFVVGSKFGVRMIGLNVWIIQLFCGIATALLFNAVLSLIKNTILLYLKHLQIASICVPDKNPNVVVFGRIKTVGTIVILNSILRGVASELMEAIKNGTAANISLISGLNNNMFIKGGKYIVKKCFDYMDECVLAYCYNNKEVALGKAAEKAIVIFLENTGKFLIKTTTVSLTSAFVKIIISIFEILILIRTVPFTFLNIIYIYLVVHVTGFIVADSLIEPLMLQGIIKEFCKCQLTDENNIGVFEGVATIATKLKNLI